MKILTLLVSLLALNNSFAQSGIEDRLYCYSTIFGREDASVEISAIKETKEKREVYFRKNQNKRERLVTEKCHYEHAQNLMICEWKKGKIEVSLELSYHRGLWDAAGYSYFPATVYYKNLGLFKHAGKIRCR